MDIIDGEYPPGVFLRGLKFSDEKIRGIKFLGENLRGLKSISKFVQFFSTFPFFWKIQVQTFEGLVYCSKTPASTSLYNNDAQI